MLLPSPLIMSLNYVMFSVFQHQSQVAAAMERAKQVTSADLAVCRHSLLSSLKSEKQGLCTLPMYTTYVGPHYLCILPYVGLHYLHWPALSAHYLHRPTLPACTTYVGLHHLCALPIYPSYIAYLPSLPTYIHHLRTPCRPTLPVFSRTKVLVTVS